MKNKTNNIVLSIYCSVVWAVGGTAWADQIESDLPAQEPSTLIQDGSSPDEPADALPAQMELVKSAAISALAGPTINIPSVFYRPTQFPRLQNCVSTVYLQNLAGGAQNWIITARSQELPTGSVTFTGSINAGQTIAVNGTTVPPGVVLPFGIYALAINSSASALAAVTVHRGCPVDLAANERPRANNSLWLLNVSKNYNANTLLRTFVQVVPQDPLFGQPISVFYYNKNGAQVHSRQVSFSKGIARIDLFSDSGVPSGFVGSMLITAAGKIYASALTYSNNGRVTAFADNGFSGSAGNGSTDPAAWTFAARAQRLQAPEGRTSYPFTLNVGLAGKTQGVYLNNLGGEWKRTPLKTLATRALFEFAPSSAGLPAGAVGSAVITSIGSPTLLLTNVMVKTESKWSPSKAAISTYPGVSRGDAQLAVPFVGSGPANGTEQTSIAVQNISGSVKTVNVTYYNVFGTKMHEFTTPLNSLARFVTSSADFTSSPFSGSVIVKDVNGFPSLAVAVSVSLRNIGNTSAAFNGVPALP